MRFNSIVFIWIFLPIFILCYCFLEIKKIKRCQNVFLIVASLIFYSWGDIKALPFLLGVITISWGFGILIGKANKYSKGLLITFLIVLLGLLAYFKYYNFIVEQINNIWKTSISSRESYAPLGISFIVFQAISYMVDIYRKDINAETSWINVALYMSFFPQLISGPIIRYNSIRRTLKERRTDTGKIKDGIQRFIVGLAKKTIIADSMGYMVDTILSIDTADWGTLFSWLVLIGYSLQIYYDFSGYTDMALGLGKAIGFELPENFNYPYLANSIKDFWRRWHITLSSWFRDYLYIPLGGSRRGKYRTYFNVFIVFLTTGLWHGASWNFVLWGVWHGTFNILEKSLGGKHFYMTKDRAWKHIYALAVVSIGWVFFRIDSLGTALKLIYMLVIPTRIASTLSLYYIINPYIVFVIIIGILFCGPIQIIRDRLNKRIWIKNKTLFNDKKVMNAKYLIKGAWFGILFVYSLTQVVASTYSAFIYQQF